MRRGAALLTVTAVLTAGSGCAGDNAASGAVTTITALDYYTDKSEHTQWGRLLSACGRSAGVRVEHRSVPGPSLVPTVLRQASARELPDVLMLDNADVQQVAETGALTPLSDFGVDTGGYSPGIASAGTYRGKVYGVTPAVNAAVLFYNKDMLDEAGVAVPRTWDELKAAAQRLTRPGRYGMAVSAGNTAESSWQFLPFLWSNGGEETDLGDPRAAQALGLWTDLVRSGAMSRSVLNWDQADVHDQFAAGRTAMMINGPWRISALEKAGDIRWGTAPIPVRERGQSVVTALGGELWTVPTTASPARQAKAAEVIDCLTGRDTMLTVAGQYSTVPARTAVAEEYVEHKPSMAVFADAVEHARARTARVGTAWPKVADRIHRAIQLALTGEKTPAEALAEARRREP
ncbi:sugar ABC transporter substrate-binding protein [Streptomyces daghestanicus]|uniref:Sugar ABC transporter substrate-binding protein n=1 Tax=Streptomyces daghestanicus TaxID=66885 RepID=A0ABQ3Q3Y0_9ACTN|nr:sugar ABC transporter substrate-binding protein [Streptomyces daghestanicus]GHI31995.1 sugar ABC transporter substrate-binding protein [Streptomyces daghestanicus]